ncbi:MAG: hypothetical protein U0934_09235 [Pseudotabrizicola sp.]|uniref:hypothetical protein n=1 Tax=Pseudotabrizicola sp. TaxID=2939647 RepID=UPI002730F0F3|nr:hypothetical protein [Pseudotabrizicola sp.]MDZ7574126.1 hypothetical protein [Pseudotabrizicola sp.]
MMGGAFALIAIISTAAWAETTAPADIVQEDAYLDVLPKIEIPENVQPIPGAVNEEFRNCEAAWPAGYALARSGPEARALRDIYGLVRVRNVIETQNCGCTGKVATWEEVEAVAAALRDHHDVQRLSWQQTKAIAEEAAALTAVAETMCGGSF